MSRSGFACFVDQVWVNEGVQRNFGTPLFTPVSWKIGPNQSQFAGLTHAWWANWTGTEHSRRSWALRMCDTETSSCHSADPTPLSEACLFKEVDISSGACLLPLMHFFSLSGLGLVQLVSEKQRSIVCRWKGRDPPPSERRKHHCFF